MLPLLAVLLFAIFGIAALAIDTGLAFSTQSQLEASGRTLALERARFFADALRNELSEMDRQEWDSQRRELERDLLLDEAADPPTHTPIPQGTRSEYARRRPLLFGMAALLPATVGPDGRPTDGLSVRELLDARAAGDPTPVLSTGGLRGSGFELRAAVGVVERPVFRVGPPIPNDEDPTTLCRGSPPSLCSTAEQPRRSRSGGSCRTTRAHTPRRRLDLCRPAHRRQPPRTGRHGAHRSGSH